MRPQSDDIALELRDVSKSFGNVRALQNASLRIERRTIHAVVGQNGAGKSTLMQILVGVFPPDAGMIVLDGVETSIHDPDHARRLGIRIIYQELNLIPYQTVIENISLGIEPRTKLRLLDRRAMRRRATAALARLGHEKLVDRRIDELDVSQQQVVEIAKALAWDARVLILDEPTAALERQDVERLFEVLRRFREQGGTALYVSHRLEELVGLCETVTVLRDGKVVDTVATASTTKAEVIRLMIGRQLQEVFPEHDADAEAPVLLEATRIRTSELRDVSLQARTSRILGVVGLEGSGIRELGRVLAGDRPPDEGDIHLEGVKTRLDSPGRSLAAGIVYLSADRKNEGLFPILSVAQNIAVGTLDERRRLGFIDLSAEAQLVGRSIERLAIRTPSSAQEIRFLSGGNQQKALIARALAAHPRVFVLDEPTRGVDVGAKAELYLLIRELANAGAAVIIISTDLTEIVGMSDELLVLREGYVTGRFGAGVSEREVLSHLL
jgi:ribose transport system ATP-binding protein